MNKSFLANERILLRAPELCDLDVMYEMENDPELWDITNFTVPYSRFSLQNYIEHSSYDMFSDRQLRLMIVLRSNGEVLGTIDISDFHPRHARGEVGVSLRKEYRKQGFAREALQLLCDYAFHFLHMKQLTAHTAADNHSALKLFRTCGFRRCGVLKSWWMMADGYHDVVVLQCIRPDE
ncbi:MAG: GNAT family N-acetyltransferase [Bacteroides sp.]|nr:GNAT family N-acetyltransferase [Bacteroides sp.]MBQ8224106.1 GNAT family N-acetyltransferase [Bacteroides sp.]